MLQNPTRISIVISALVALSASCSGGGSSGGSGATGGTAGSSGSAGSAGNAGSGAEPGYPIGTGDGTPGSVTLTTIFEPPVAREATALAFNSARPNELWVTLREYYEGLPCSSTIKQGCLSNEGRIALIVDPGGPAPTSNVLKDQNALHFMRRPTSIAFGPDGTFATCHEARTGNMEDGPGDYIGPTLWTSDPAIFTKPQPAPPNGEWIPNGSHIDMLHQTPFCMGIAHEKDNVYWTFNGQIGAIDRYDFKNPHPPGADDHSDGEVLRYVVGSVARVENVPSHMVFDPSTAQLYIADTGNKRIAKLDTASGQMGAPFPPYDPIAVHHIMDNVTIVDFVPPGQLEQPSGLALHEGVLYVTDHATSAIHAFDMNGTLLRSLDTGLPPGTLAGITIGPDAHAYIVDKQTSAVRRIDVP